jgi:hypothetical protein
MSREQRTSSQRQFIHPASVIRSAVSPETPGSLPTVEEQAKRARLATVQTMPGTKAAGSASPSWQKMSRNGHYYDTFAPPTEAPDHTWQEQNATPEFWSIPQPDQNPAPWQDWDPEAQSLAGSISTLSQAAPFAPTRQGRSRETDSIQGVKATSSQILKKKSPQSGSLATQNQSWQKGYKKQARKKRVPVWLAIVSVIMLIVIGLTQGNGMTGAWLADVVRAVAGPVAAAQVEAAYLNVQNKVNQAEFQLGLRHVTAPFQMTSTAGMNSARPAGATLKPMPLSNMQAFITPTLPGEGEWNELEAAPAPYNYLPLDARAFIRPDPNYPYAVVSLLQFDMRFSRLHVVSGTQEPGGALGNDGTGTIPTADQAGNTLLAVMNGGFKYADGAFGLMTDGKVYVPPVQGAATIAITNTGQLIMGAWGVDPQLNSNNRNLVAWRQNNNALLIDNGQINPLTNDGAAWGGTILNSEYTWRSGLGITAQGNLVYAGGSSLLPSTLGIALKDAGAVMAMETDINPFWVRAFLYDRNPNGTLTITKLDPQMQGTGQEYFNQDQRDFFYLTRYTPPAKTTK